MIVLTDTGSQAKRGIPANMKVCPRGAWNERMLVETVLSMLTTVFHQEHGTVIAIRQVKYLNKIVAQDHRAVKQITRPMLGFKSFDAAQCTLVGVALMHMNKNKPDSNGFSGKIPSY
jgi:transposase-like protein